MLYGGQLGWAQRVFWLFGTHKSWLNSSVVSDGFDSLPCQHCQFSWGRQVWVGSAQQPCQQTTIIYCHNMHHHISHNSKQPNNNQNKNMQQKQKHNKSKTINKSPNHTHTHIYIYTHLYTSIKGKRAGRREGGRAEEEEYASWRERYQLAGLVS